MRLDLPEAGVPLTIRGGTAGWPSEPFVLGSLDRHRGVPLGRLRLLADSVDMKTPAAIAAGVLRCGRADRA